MVFTCKLRVLSLDGGHIICLICSPPLCHNEFYQSVYRWPASFAQLASFRQTGHQSNKLDCPSKRGSCANASFRQAGHQVGFLPGVYLCYSLFVVAVGHMQPVSQKTP